MRGGRQSRDRPRRAFLGSAVAAATLGGCLRLQSQETATEGATDTPGSDTTSTDGPRAIRLGLLLPLSGGLAGFASHMKKAAELPIQRIRDADVGLRVETKAGDTGADPDFGPDAAQDLVDAGYRTIFGPVTSPVTLATAGPVFASEGAVACSPSATSPAITDAQDSDFLFRTGPNDALRGDAAATATAEQTSVSAVGLVHIDTAWERATAGAFAERYQGLGGTVQTSVAVGADRDSYASPLRDALAGDPDAVAISAKISDLVPILRDLRGEVGSDLPVVLTRARDRLVDEAGFDLGDVRGVRQVPAGDGREAFRQQYREAYDRDPGRFDATSYDAAAVLLLANARAGSNDGRAVRDALREVANPEGTGVKPGTLPQGIRLARRGEAVQYGGASGSVDFDDNGDVTSFTYAFVRYVEGTTERVTTVTAEA